MASSGGSDPLCAAKDNAEDKSAVADTPGTDITAQWLQALTAVGNSTGDPGWAHQLIDGLTAMITGMAARPDEARRVGANVARELVAAHFTHTETIAVTIETMQGLLPERFDPATRAALFAGLAEGYAHALRERVYTEQDRIERALQEAHKADTIRLHALHRRLLQQASRDPLTGLPNRARLVRELAAEHRTTGPGRRIGVCFLDLDDFTSVNDTLGHQSGDRLLTTVANRLRAITDPRRHLVTRTGADEFAIMVRDCDGPTDLTDLAQNALATVREPIQIDGRPVHMTASAGLVEPRSDHPEPTDVLRAGDAALSWAKSDGPARWALFEPDRHARQRRCRTLSQQLPAAIDRGELFLEYQPIVDLTDGGVHRMEALVRWNHPSRGRLSPDQFVPLAEQSGAIVALGRWVLRHAATDAAGWPSAPDGRRVEVAVNVTVRQLHEPHICHEIAALLAETGLPAAQLHVEITESQVVRPGPGDSAVPALQALADLGVGVAIDDFGTGYSSLAYLHRLPAHMLKIDQSFIAALAPADQPGTGTVEAIVAGLIDMAHACKMTVTAEGVQTRSQLLRLRALGAEAAQGFLLGRPVPDSQVAAVLTTPIAL